jgi:hypothetical protein
MTASFDDLPIEVRRERWGWFGEPWPSYICYDDDDNLLSDMRKPFPSGESCLLCGEPFSEDAGDSGQAIPDASAGILGHQIAHVHKECMLVNVVGPLAHHEHLCRCHRGTTETPGMTCRQEALEVWRRFTANS